jgi:hypothetical protein
MNIPTKACRPDGHPKQMMYRHDELELASAGTMDMFLASLERSVAPNAGQMRWTY